VHASALTQSAVESRVVLRLNIPELNTKHCSCMSTYTVCCRERRIVEAILSFDKHKILLMRALLQSAIDRVVDLRLYSLLINPKYCAYALTYTVCCREWRSVEAIYSAAKQETLCMQSHLQILLYRAA
jgi:hypothetical protein